MKNRAESSGQMHDLHKTQSDDGTVPPTAIREAITTPERVEDIHMRPGGPLDMPRALDSRPAYANGSGLGAAAANDRETTTADAKAEPSQGETALSPADPRRTSDQGQPYLDDANPFGRAIPNQQNRPMGGLGDGQTVDPARHHAPDKPGERTARHGDGSSGAASRNSLDRDH